MESMSTNVTIHQEGIRIDIKRCYVFSPLYPFFRFSCCSYANQVIGKLVFFLNISTCKQFVPSRYVYF